MIRDITIGQYYPADSMIHKLDPRTKLVGTIAFIVSVFLFHTFLGYAVAGVFLAGMILMSNPALPGIRIPLQHPVARSSAPTGSDRRSRLPRL